MVASIRELANTLTPITSKPLYNQYYISKHHLMNIGIKLPRECSSSPSINSLRGTSANSAA